MHYASMQVCKYAQTNKQTINLFSHNFSHQPSPVSLFYRAFQYFGFPIIKTRLCLFSQNITLHAHRRALSVSETVVLNFPSGPLHIFGSQIFLEPFLGLRPYQTGIHEIHWLFCKWGTR